MEMLGWQVAILVGVLAVCFTGPALGIFLLQRRKRLARRQRRSPIGISLLRSPGHTLREQIDETQGDATAYGLQLMLIPLMLCTVLLAFAHLHGMAWAWRLAPGLTLMAVVWVAYVIRQMLKAGARLDNLRAGYDAELAVGQQLDQLMRQGAVTFHDLPGQSFNIDHVVVSTSGVFAVETKGYTKPKNGRGKADATVVFDGQQLKYPSWTTREPLEQAERQAQWLARWLSSAVGSPVYVLPVLALPGWFVERTGRGPVRVYNGKELAGLLRPGESGPLSEQDVQRIAHQLDQRCRTVAPRYAEVESTG